MRIEIVCIVMAICLIRSSFSQEKKRVQEDKTLIPYNSGMELRNDVPKLDTKGNFLLPMKKKKKFNLKKKPMNNRISNDLLNRSADEADYSKSGSICRNIPGLTNEQVRLCRKSPDATNIAVQGLQQSVYECQFQFQKHRWNCSSLSKKSKNPQASVMLQRGYRETAFAYAISAAGVTHAISRACSQGDLVSCGCDRPNSGFAGQDWKWGGCSHNVEYGVKFSRSFLDVKEKAKDMQSQINLHNNQAGRLVVSHNTEMKCKCHGMSGSCEMKTCWRATPDFRRVGTILKDRYDYAILIDQSALGNGARGNPKRLLPRNRRKTPSETDLLYYERSPTFCEAKADVGFPGISGRRCNRTSTDVDSCDSLCCGRGYNTIRQRRVERCRCRFKWCCEVECENCTIEEWITVCK
uniref:Protein Wnt n=1 Tax=Thamnocephalus platyurus TaxID=91582 RepID=A0A0S1NFD5_9CRUS|nr:Wnt10 ligand [Thamnocephalus platyurus]